jgi:hypothetical protein
MPAHEKTAWLTVAAAFVAVLLTIFNVVYGAGGRSARVVEKVATLEKDVADHEARLREIEDCQAGMMPWVRGIARKLDATPIYLPTDSLSELPSNP